MSEQISAILDLDHVDVKSIPSAYWRKGTTKADVVTNFLTEELAKAGGKALVESDDKFIGIWWDPPAAEEGDPFRAIYCGHLIQSGLSRDPSLIIANTVYSGGGNTLTQTLLTIGTRGYNRYVAERDCQLLVDAAPLFSAGWFSLALIQINNKNFKGARASLERILEIFPRDWVSMKYLSIVLTKSSPRKAVRWAEEAIRVMGESGSAPDQHMRLTYGMALRAAGNRAEAERQFDFACGYSPSMTPEQWSDWGYATYGDDVDLALKNPFGYAAARQREFGS